MKYTLLKLDGTKVEMDGSVSKYITDNEASCSHCGECVVFEPMVQLFNEVRDFIGNPIIINSCYRCEDYQKILQGTNKNAATYSPHVTGAAMDLAIPKDLDLNQFKTLFSVMSRHLGFGKPRFGYKQYDYRFLHVDLVYLVPGLTHKPAAWREGVEW